MFSACSPSLPPLSFSGVWKVTFPQLSLASPPRAPPRACLFPSSNIQSQWITGFEIRHGYHRWTAELAWETIPKSSFRNSTKRSGEQRACWHFRQLRAPRWIVAPALGKGYRLISLISCPWMRQWSQSYFSSFFPITKPSQKYICKLLSLLPVKALHLFSW